MGLAHSKLPYCWFLKMRGAGTPRPTPHPAIQISFEGSPRPPPAHDGQPHSSRRVCGPHSLEAKGEQSCISVGEIRQVIRPNCKRQVRHCFSEMINRAQRENCITSSQGRWDICSQSPSWATFKSEGGYGLILCRVQKCFISN